MLVSAYLQDWLDTYIIPVKAPSTAACYRRALSVLPPSVLSAPLAAVSPMAIQRAINLKARQHPRAAQLTYAVLHAAMARAVKLGLIPRNPLDLCDKPAHKPARALILDPQQIPRLSGSGRRLAQLCPAAGHAPVRPAPLGSIGPAMGRSGFGPSGPPCAPSASPWPALPAENRQKPPGHRPGRPCGRRIGPRPFRPAGPQLPRLGLRCYTRPSAP